MERETAPERALSVDCIDLFRTDYTLDKKLSNLQFNFLDILEM